MNLRFERPGIPLFSLIYLDNHHPPHQDGYLCLFYRTSQPQEGDAHCNKTEMQNLSLTTVFKKEVIQHLLENHVEPADGIPRKI
jgi:hypothetical protein